MYHRKCAEFAGADTLSETQLPWYMLLQFNDLLNDCHDSLKIVTVKALASDHLRNFEKVVARAGRLQE